MSLEPQQETQGISPIIITKTLLLNKEEEAALDVLREGAEAGNVMACYDCGFLMIQGIGCEKKDWEGGLELLAQGRKLEEQDEHTVWKSDGSATDVLEPQSMDLSRLF